MVGGINCSDTSGNTVMKLPQSWHLILRKLGNEPLFEVHSATQQTIRRLSETWIEQGFGPEENIENYTLVWRQTPEDWKIIYEHGSNLITGNSPIGQAE